MTAEHPARTVASAVRARLVPVLLLVLASFAAPPSATARMPPPPAPSPGAREAAYWRCYDETLAGWDTRYAGTSMSGASVEVRQAVARELCWDDAQRRLVPTQRPATTPR